MDTIFNAFMRHSSSLCKCIYCGHCAYFKMEYPRHQQKSCFNGQEENREAPLAIKIYYIIANGEKRMQFIKDSGICGSKNDPLNDSGVKYCAYSISFHTLSIYPLGMLLNLYILRKT